MTVWIQTPNGPFSWQQWKCLYSSYPVTWAAWSPSPRAPPPRPANHTGGSGFSPIFGSTHSWHSVYTRILDSVSWLNSFEIFLPLLCKDCRNLKFSVLVLQDSMTVGFFLNVSVHDVSWHLLSGKKIKKEKENFINLPSAFISSSSYLTSVAFHSFYVVFVSVFFFYSFSVSNCNARGYSSTSNSFLHDWEPIYQLLQDLSWSTGSRSEGL